MSGHCCVAGAESAVSGRIARPSQTEATSSSSATPAKMPPTSVKMPCASPGSHGPIV